MKRFLWEVIGFTTLLIIVMIGMAYAQTIYTRQDTVLNGTGGQVIAVTAFSDSNPVLTGPIQVDTKRTACFDIDFIDASASITSVNLSCTYGRTALTVTTYRLPVFTSTSAAGVTNSTPSTIRQVSTTGGAPGTSGWGWCITNIPGPFLECSFLANGVITADVDTIAVFVRGITP